MLDTKGNTINVFLERPLQEEIPIGGTYTGPRYYHWQPLKEATVYWTEALDEGDPEKEVPFRDRVMSLDYPFDGTPKELIKTEFRYSGIDWSENENEFICYEYERDTFETRAWLKSGKNDKKLVYELNAKDKYNHPGRLLKKETPNGSFVFLKRQSTLYYLNNNGATEKGNFPYFAEFNLKTNEKTVLFKSEKGYHETIAAVLEPDISKIVIRRESAKKPRNYYIYDINKKQRTPLTGYENPYPEITELKKELIQYKREDGIPLYGTLYLPADYEKGKRLPLIIHAYPDEFANAETAGQVDASPNKFISFWGATIKYLTFEGYAVLANASVPIVGKPESVNDNFLEQIDLGIKGAVDYLNHEKIIDPGRVGVIGHSYGAFMVANVLAHSDICKTGIAKSGAYNRTLTPFGFQHERRPLWEAKDFYIKISPFMHAEKINEPLLLIHGAEDNNSGTYTMQSKRMYQAIKGNGGTARLVILPHEEHSYRAKESNLHVLAEFIEWFNKYLK